MREVINLQKRSLKLLLKQYNSLKRAEKEELGLEHKEDMLKQKKNQELCEWVDLTDGKDDISNFEDFDQNISEESLNLDKLNIKTQKSESSLRCCGIKSRLF